MAGLFTVGKNPIWSSWHVALGACVFSSVDF